MAKRLTLEMLRAAKERNQFTWFWAQEETELPPQRSRSFNCGTRIAEFEVRCGVCKQPHWILWQELKNGRTKTCVACAKAPTHDDLLATGLKYGSYYTPTNRHKIHNGRRFYWMRCRCGKEKWIGLNAFNCGKAMGCKRCRTGLLKHGLSHDPIYRVWQTIHRRHPNEVCLPWKKFETFYKWAKPLWLSGWKIKRIDISIPFSPDNCDFVPVDRTKASIAVDGLPVSERQVLYRTA